MYEQLKKFFDMVRRDLTLSTADTSDKQAKNKTLSTLKDICSQAQSFVLMAEPSIGSALNVDAILQGKRDRSYTAPSSINFSMDCKQFDTLAQALKATSHQRPGTNKSVYIFAMGYDKDQVATFASQGQFSKSIIAAINAKQLREHLDFKIREEKDLEICHNQNYQPANNYRSTKTENVCC